MMARDSDHSKLHPKFRQQIKMLLAKVQKRTGIQFSVGETWRSIERQLSLSSKNTKAGAGESHHFYGLAVDLFGPDPKNYWDPKLPWSAIGEVCDEMGLGWGGHWKMKDLGHIYVKTPAPEWKLWYDIYNEAGRKAVWDHINPKEPNRLFKLNSLWRKYVR